MDVAKQVVIYHRWGEGDEGEPQRFVIVLNFSDRNQTVRVPFPENGVWTDLLNGLRGDWQVEVGDYQLDIFMESNWGRVLFK